MAKKIYKDGEYTGKEILSEQEHKERLSSAFMELVRHNEKLKESKYKRMKFYKNWHNTNWLWFLLLFCWPLGCYGIYKRYFKNKTS